MSPQAVQGDYISDLNPVVTPATELTGGLFEVEVLTGPVAGAYVSKRLTVEQLVAYVLAQHTAPPVTLTADAALADVQAALRNDLAPFTAGVRYNLSGDWNATGNPAQVVYVQAATAISLERNGTLYIPGQPVVAVLVDVVAGTAIDKLGLLAARDANLYAHYADNTVAPFNTLDDFLAAAGLHGGTLRLEGEATVLSLTKTNRGGWPAFWDAGGATIVVPAGEALKSSAAGAENLAFGNFYLDGGGTFLFSGQMDQATTSAGRASRLFDGFSNIPLDNPANVVLLDGGYYKQIIGAGKYYLAGTVEVEDLTQASNVVDLRGGGGGGTPLSPATTTTLGGLIVGAGLQVDGTGKVSLRIDPNTLAQQADGTLYVLPSSGNISPAATPTNVTAVRDHPRSGTMVRWDAMPGATFYQVYRQENGGPWGLIAGVPYNYHYDNSGPGQGDQFILYYIVAANSAGQSPNSAIAQAQ